jgi:hypothetical protein
VTEDMFHPQIDEGVKKEAGAGSGGAGHGWDRWLGHLPLYAAAVPARDQGRIGGIYRIFSGKVGGRMPKVVGNRAAGAIAMAVAVANLSVRKTDQAAALTGL